jgi:hypothetical protein
LEPYFHHFESKNYPIFWQNILESSNSDFNAISICSSPLTGPLRPRAPRSTSTSRSERSSGGAGGATATAAVNWSRGESTKGEKEEEEKEKELTDMK